MGQRILLAVAPRVVWALLWIFGRTWRFVRPRLEDLLAG